MNTHEYTARIAQCLEDNPVLGTCLQRVVTAWRCRNPGSHPLQVTLCDTRGVTLFDLVRLFSPGAIKTRRNKYVFLPEKMAGSGINLDEWLHAAAALLGDEPEKSSEPNNTANMLCGRLSMLFPALDAALDTLRQQPGNVKRKITEVGFAQAMEHYQHCLTATQFLKTNTRTLSASDLGVRVCNNSKAFRPGTACYHTAAQLLAAEIGCDTQEAMTICGVIDNPTAAIVTVFGPFIYYRHNQPLRWIKQLWETGEAATLNFGNLEKVDRIELETAPAIPVISCENESPFNAMMRKTAPAALIYTVGYPNSAVKRFVALLNNNIEYRHWGDTDPDGFAIASMLNSIRKLKLFRCDLTACQRLRDRLKPLDAAKQERARKMLGNPDFPFRHELEFTIEHGWLEQESWLAP